MGWRRRLVVPLSRVTPGEGRSLSSRQTQDVVKDPEIGRPINSGPRSETARRRCTRKRRQNWISLLCPLRQDRPRGHSGAHPCPVPLQQGRAGRRTVRTSRSSPRRNGVERWLGELALALRPGDLPTGPNQTLRAYPKANGKAGRWASQPCGIGVCMTAAMLVLEPIFEADLPSSRLPSRAETLQQAVVLEGWKSCCSGGHPEGCGRRLCGLLPPGSILHAELFEVGPTPDRRSLKSVSDQDVAGLPCGRDRRSLVG